MPLMPSTTKEGRDHLRVCITGFGDFGPYDAHKENPAWLAVKQLHDRTLYTTQPPVYPASVDEQQQTMLTGPGTPYLKQHPIHVTTLRMPVVYSDILSIIPGLHARPPLLPDSRDEKQFPISTPPAQGYDLVFHVGVGSTGGVYVEKLGHKLGYNLKDADGKQAPVVSSPSSHSGASAEIKSSKAAKREKTRLGTDAVTAGKSTGTRGFGKGYEEFDEELLTDIDVHRLVHDLKATGIRKIETSLDAGRYLCDFIYYCSLAEARRTFAARKGKGRKTQVLFMHCPPVGEDLTSDEVTEAIQRVVIWVCSAL